MKASFSSAFHRAGPILGWLALATVHVSFGADAMKVVKGTSSGGIPQFGALNVPGTVGGSSVLQYTTGGRPQLPRGGAVFQASPTVPAPTTPATLGTGQGPAPQSFGRLGHASFATVPYLPKDETMLPLVQDGSQLNVTLPAGILQVTLETSTKGGWKPLDTKHVNGTAQTVAFALPDGIAITDLRARALRHDRFAAGQWRGSKAFVWQDGGQPTLGPVQVSSGGILLRSGVGVAADNVMTLSGTAVASTTNTLTAARTTSATNDVKTAVAADTTATAEAVESDIWKVIGDRLFFFNQYRGLQVFDMKDPAHPVKTGSVRMAAVGEQFYALDDKGSYLALLAKNNSRKYNSGSAVHVLSVSADGKPAEVAQLALDGAVAESRLVGTRLYVLVSSWDYSTSFSKVSLVGFELAKPEAPVKLGSVDLPPGYYLQLQADSHYLMVSSSTSGGWWWGGDANNWLSVLDISGDGAPRLAKSVTTKGCILDQFKMHIDGDTLTTVSQAWVVAPIWPGGWDTTVRQTWVENFSLSAPGSGAVGQLKLDKADGETLYATRFDGKRLYVVTFFQTDPLFIIDLTDPTNPQLKGELVTPGWSAYIEPQGNRLLAVGVEVTFPPSTGEQLRVCASWFDVSNPSAPKLLSRVYPGDGVHSTWSEAIYDHKAVNWDKPNHKVFLPFQPWSWWDSQNNPGTATQVINLADDKLTLGIAIKNEGTARRGTVINGCLASISGRQLVVTTNPDTGEATQLATLELSWPVDRVVALNNGLIQIESGNPNSCWGWLQTSSQETVVRLSDKADPDTVLDTVSLGYGDVIGVTQSGNRAYLAQYVSSPPVLRTWALDVDGNGKLQKSSGAAVAVDSAFQSRFNISGTQGLWVASGTLVWHVPAQPNYWWNWWYGWYPYPILAVRSAPGILAGNVINFTTDHYVTAATPSLPLSDTTSALEFPVGVNLDGSLVTGDTVAVEIPADGGRLSAVGKAFAENGLLIFSAERGNTYAPIYNTTQDYAVISNCYRIGWLSPQTLGFTCSLQVLDFTGGLTPVVRDPVSLAGHLLGVSAVDKDGAYLVTARDATYDATSQSYRRHLTSLAYDGVSASEVDTADLTSWSVQDFAQGRLFLALAVRSADGFGTSAKVIGLRLDPTTGLFVVNDQGWLLDDAPSSLKVDGGYLLASNWGDLEVAKITSDLSLLPVAGLDLSLSVWYNLDRASADPDGSGLWLPAGDYGVDLFGFPK